MRILRSGPVFDRWHEVTFGRTIGAEFVGDDPLGWHALLLQQPEQQSPCSPGVAPALNDFIENLAVLIDGTPKPVLSAGDGNHNLIEVPDVLARRSPATELLCVSRPEFPSPSPDRFIRDDDPALQQ